MPKADVRVELAAKAAAWILSVIEEIREGEEITFNTLIDKITIEASTGRRKIDTQAQAWEGKSRGLRSRWAAAVDGGSMSTIQSVLAEIRAFADEIKPLPETFEHLDLSMGAARVAVAKRICALNGWTLYQKSDGTWASHDPWWGESRDNGWTVAAALNRF